MTTNQVLLEVGLILVLAVGSQVLASRLGIGVGLVGGVAGTDTMVLLGPAVGGS